mmetsp:Transcript_89705/g.225608  ORF Transcript_89705/g.225608 Transcript_89705/m.225608 type:complete len:289 (+) Transcript_89705:199-1065(+)
MGIFLGTGLCGDGSPPGKGSILAIADVPQAAAQTEAAFQADHAAETSASDRGVGVGGGEDVLSDAAATGDCWGRPLPSFTSTTASAGKCKSMGASALLLGMSAPGCSICKQIGFRAGAHFGEGGGGVTGSSKANPPWISCGPRGVVGACSMRCQRLACDWTSELISHLLAASGTGTSKCCFAGYVTCTNGQGLLLDEGQMLLLWEGKQWLQRQLSFLHPRRTLSSITQIIGMSSFPPRGMPEPTDFSPPPRRRRRSAEISKARKSSTALYSNRNHKGAVPIPPGRSAG